MGYGLMVSNAIFNNTSVI